jgi:ubiquinone/menaquinone biosynthesis C-methylase UbiE
MSWHAIHEIDPMRELNTKEPDYGNWVTVRLLSGLGAISVLLLSLSFVSPILVVGAAPFVLAFVYFAYARYEFSARGGNVQARIQELVLGCLDWDGKGQALDIGCGNAPLTIMIAKKFPSAHVTGIDNWGEMWEYSRGICERNATVEGVADRVNFQKASASALPFERESFDVAVSNLVFHEVSDAKDKRDVIREALRVVKKGGKFTFQDLFLEKRLYGEIPDLLEAIRSWGTEKVEFLDTSHSDFVPTALKLPFMVGTIGILHGKK